MGSLLLINPRSGDERPSADQLVAAARERGVETRLLEAGDDPCELALAAGHDAVGIAGGDGSLAGVAKAALERDIPLVCIPFGTRNHFARDLGLDRDDPLGSLDAFAGVERRIDVGCIGERVFLNNVSLGAYAGLVHRRERHRRRRQALAGAHALWLSLKDRHPKGFLVDGEPVVTRILLIANNAYSVDLLSIGERPTLDSGQLYLYAAQGWFPDTWVERNAGTFTVDTSERPLQAAVDGEPAELDPPVEFSIKPKALRVLVPRESD